MTAVTVRWQVLVWIHSTCVVLIDLPLPGGMSTLDTGFAKVISGNVFFAAVPFIAIYPPSMYPPLPIEPLSI